LSKAWNKSISTQHSEKSKARHPVISANKSVRPCCRHCRHGGEPAAMPSRALQAQRPPNACSKKRYCNDGRASQKTPHALPAAQIRQSSPA
jgi:hypothetical protein